MVKVIGIENFYSLLFHVSSIMQGTTFMACKIVSPVQYTQSCFNRPFCSTVHSWFSDTFGLKKMFMKKVWFEKNWLLIQIDFWQVFSKLRQVHSCLEKWMSCWWSLLGNWGLYSSWIGRCSTSQKGAWSWRSDNSLKFVNKNAYY